jgi:tetratricopeptide (TPR) repeat protein
MSRLTARHGLLTLVVVGALVTVIAICDRVSVRSSIIRATEALRRNEVPAAVELYQEALERRPTSGAARLGLGVAMYRLHRYEEAIQNFDRAGRLLRAARDRARANFNRGNASVLLGRLDDALEAYQVALRLDPSDQNARYNLALVRQLLQSGRPPGDGALARDSAERLVSSLGQPKARGHGRPEPLSARPAPGSSRRLIDK